MLHGTWEDAFKYSVMRIHRCVKEINEELAKYGISSYEDYEHSLFEVKRTIEREVELISNMEIKIINIVFKNDPIHEVADYAKLFKIHNVPERISEPVERRRSCRNWLQHYYGDANGVSEREILNLATDTKDVDIFVSYMNTCIITMRNGTGQGLEIRNEVQKPVLEKSKNPS